MLAVIIWKTQYWSGCITTDSLDTFLSC